MAFSRNNRISFNSVSLFLLDRILAITAERFTLEKTSAITVTEYQAFPLLQPILDIRLDRILPTPEDS